ncbi:MAG: rod shape-determining protein RodA [Acidimicrobiia bacterium]
MAIIARSSPAAVSDRRRPTPDIILFVAMVALSAVGVLMVYSASKTRLEALGLDPTGEMVDQAIFAAVGLVLFFVASVIDYREWRNVAPFIYIATLLALGAVFLFPPGSARAQRWIPVGSYQIQPAEFAKIAMIMVLAAVLVPAKEEGMSWRRLVQTIVVVAIPAVLIYIEPDLGTMLVFAFITLVMLFVGGTTLRQLTVLMTAAGAGILAIWKLELLLPYQIERLQSIFNPSAADPLGAAYNRIQSEIAIGSGGIFGKGLFLGTQTNLDFVPAQTTDFIFTAVGEQLGFVGGALVLLAYAVIMWRLVVIAVNARDRYGVLAVTGIAAMFAFHIYINVGMTVGIAPVTGLPLPFMSAGGSAFVTMAIALGIANSVWLRRSPVPGETYIV